MRFRTDCRCSDGGVRVSSRQSGAGILVSGGPRLPSCSHSGSRLAESATDGILCSVPENSDDIWGQLTMTNRSFLTRNLISAVHAVENAVARTLDTLGADSGLGHTPRVTDDADPKVAAVQQAQRAAMNRRDFELARRLSEVEQHLLRQHTHGESLLPTHHDRRTADAKLEGIRKDLLANTPRPDPTAGD